LRDQLLKNLSPELGAARRQLLKRLAIVFYPTCDMLTFRVMVRPMDDPAFLVPDILALKADAVAFLESVDSRGNVDVVCHEQCLSRRKTNNESLMSLPVQVVWQNTSHTALAFDLYIACPTRERTTGGAFVGYRCHTAFSGRAWTATRDGDEDEECTGRKDENRLRTWPAGNVLDDRCIHFSHDTRGIERGSSMSNPTSELTHRLTLSHKLHRRTQG
jgi:hypothetical protein